LSLVWELVKLGELSPIRAISALTASPARALGLPIPRLEVGVPADFVLFDPNASWIPEASQLLSKGKNSPFLGRELVGRPLLTAHAGKLIFERPKDSE
jgi:dihydroorotase